MASAYASKVGLQVYITNVGAQKIDGSTLKIFRMVLASFRVKDKLGRAQFFQETFLLADISTEIVLGIPFFTFSNVDIQFVERKLAWRSYTTAEALPTTKRVELINKKKFAKTVLDESSETFVIHHIVSLNLVSGIHPDREAQIAFCS